MPSLSGKGINSLETIFQPSSNHVKESSSEPQVLAFQPPSGQIRKPAQEAGNPVGKLEANGQSENGEGSSSKTFEHRPKYLLRVPISFSPPGSGSKRRFDEFSDSDIEGSPSTPAKGSRNKLSPASSSAIASSSRTPAQGPSADPISGFSGDYLDEGFERLLRDGFFAE